MVDGKSNVLSRQAYDMLASQPITSVGLVGNARANIVVSAVADSDGKEHALSFYGDAKWDLSPYFKSPGSSRSQKIISWPEDLPLSLTDDARAVVYAWMKCGVPGKFAPAGASVCTMVTGSAIPFMYWLAACGLMKFVDAKPIHIANYVQSVKTKTQANPKYAYDVLQMLNFIWIFRREMLSPFEANPWGDRTFGNVCGLGKLAGDDGVGKTPIIPTETQSIIFNYCEKVLDGAPAIFDERDWGKIPLGASKLIRIRDCALYILLITSGMRISEAIGIELDAGRTEIKSGVEFNWIATIEHKTKKGRVEFLVPALALRVLKLMERYAKPLQKRLANEAQTAQPTTDAKAKPEVLAQLMKAGKEARRLFIGLSQSATDLGAKRVEGMTSQTSQAALKRVAEAAGVSWNLAPHQCRRTYARCIVESRMGRASLVFLKWQFKHTSMSMTQLYASNPMQDASIFDEILQEMTDFKVDLIESWMADKPLSGGAGNEIKKLRAIPIQSRGAMLADAATQVHIRATGHGWCLAQERGCGGAGIYEATLCVGCKSSVIDESFSDVWDGIYKQQIELLEIDDAGPAVKQRAERDVKWASQVISDLKFGIAPVASNEDRGAR